MNILFYVTCTPSPFNGGIERVSYILAKEFTKYHHVCYCIYFREIDTNYISDVYKKTYHIPYNQSNSLEKVREIIKNNNIHVVLNQVGGFWDIGQVLIELRKAINFQLFTTYHSNPIENHYILNDRFSKTNNFRESIYSILYHICPIIVKYRIAYLKRRLFTNEIQGSDKYLFLSQAYKNNIIKQYKIKNFPQLTYLPNPLTFNYFFPIKDYNTIKKKQVLIVARFDELYKRLSKALSIWKSLEQYGYNGWELIIIGHGKDESFYKKMINELKIQEVVIKGKASPEPFYQEASIFLMTSTLEGWPMTLQEAMQYGCVPIAFNTFDAVNEIIQNEENGYIVQDNNDTLYRDKLIELMTNPKKRIRMAENAIESRKKYSVDQIVPYWIHMMNNKL